MMQVEISILKGAGYNTHKGAEIVENHNHSHEQAKEAGKIFAEFLYHNASDSFFNSLRLRLNEIKNSTLADLKLEYVKEN